MAAAALSLQRLLASGVYVRVEVSASAPDTSEELHVRASSQLAAGDEAKLDALRAAFPELEQQLAALVAARGEAARAALEAQPTIRRARPTRSTNQPTTPNRSQPTNQPTWPARSG
jgi:hypothetical protein